MFPTADGWLFVMCMTPKFWAGAVRGLGRPDLPTDARFRGYKERLANRDALAEILDKEFARATTAGVDASGSPAHVPVAPVLTLAAGDSTILISMTTGGVLSGSVIRTKNDFRMISSPIRVDGERVRRPACGCTRRGYRAIARRERHRACGDRSAARRRGDMT